MTSFELVALGRLSREQRAELEGDEVDPFDAARVAVTLSWRPKDLHVALRDETGRLVASAGLLVAEIQVEGQPPMPVAGIGGVIVSAAWRGQGLATRVISAVLDRAEALGPGLALLFCHRDRAELYVRHGFAEITAPVLVQHDGGWIEMPQVTMWRRLREGATLPAGPVRVNSLPF